MKLVLIFFWCCIQKLYSQAIILNPLIDFKSLQIFKKASVDTSIVLLKKGSSKTINWPHGVAAELNSGVADVIMNTQGAIGYINQSYIRGNIKAASIQNLSGQFDHSNFVQNRL